MKRYICIGGPLDGEFLSSDQRPEHNWDSGMVPNPIYEPFLRDYIDYNSSSGGNKSIPSMIRIHKSLIEGKRPKVGK